jgi:hypothetical protein
MEEQEEVKEEARPPWEQESYLDKFESFLVTVSPVTFKHSKSVLLSFTVLTETKAKFQLMGMHTRLIA